MGNKKLEGRQRRRLRIRKKVEGSTERPRLSVFRSNKQIYAQVIDDSTGKTMAAASSLGKDKPSEGGKVAVAAMVGEAIAAVCKERGISQVEKPDALRGHFVFTHCFVQDLERVTQRFELRLLAGQAVSNLLQ